MRIILTCLFKLIIYSLCLCLQYLNRALNAAYEGANEIIQFSKRIDNLKIIKKGTNDFSTNLDQYVEQKVFENLQKYYQILAILVRRLGPMNYRKRMLMGIRSNRWNKKLYISIPTLCIIPSMCERTEGNLCCDHRSVRNDVFCAGEDTGALLNNKRIRTSAKVHYKMLCSAQRDIQIKIKIILLSHLKLISF